MQDSLPDIPQPVLEKEEKPSFFQRFKNAGNDDKRLVRIFLLIVFGLLLLLGIAASILEQVAPRGGNNPDQPDQFSSGLWQIEPRPNQAVFGFFEDANLNRVFDYREKPFDKVTVAIRRQGETEPFRRVAASTDGLVKIDDLDSGEYEMSLDNSVQPEAADWMFFEEFQRNGEFFPTVWQKVTLTDTGYKELIGINAYRPPLLLVLQTDTGLSWYDPDRARVYAQTSFNAEFVSRGRDIYYLGEGRLKKMSWEYRAVSEELNWLDEAISGSWFLSPQSQTVAYIQAQEFKFRSQEPDCSEGDLLVDGVRPQVKSAGFLGETAWLVIGRLNQSEPWQVFKVDCQKAETLVTVAEPLEIGVLVGGDWFYSTNDAAYFVSSEAKTVKYMALGGGNGVSVSQDGRYLLKKASSGNWLAVDYPAVKAEGVEKHYLLTGIAGEPTIIGDALYFVRAKACEADGDCGEVVKITLEGSGNWSVAQRWDLKNVAAAKILGVVN